MAPGVSSFPKKVVATRAGIFRNVMGLIAKVLKQKERDIDPSLLCFNNHIVYSSTKPGRISLYRCGGRNPPPGTVLRPIPTAPDGRSETP